ncbi:phytoene/squalene synthase family protein [Demequina sp. TTPB684]|uniref:phytoene/squalene synthase family protein n=1 Tax=unclassified Demequina TaxID=2620311 RepID=UPI001CF25330|nr:phytoene/squalene synthase family protein [Demequina sp. TMPB413]MCB2412630.1 phytoene/squalene synthase family protein [Demequina sp. TTPB684]UPU87916.1 phytoene/squalene synthase family protein [Demequina sp. TMPB413]
MNAHGGRAHHDNTTSLALYDQTAQAAAATVLAKYSTSFGAGTRLLGRTMRTHIRSIYAMVRVADEIVDTYRGEDARAMLDSFEGEVNAALDSAFSANLVAHAFALSAKQVGIGRDLTEPFFASMRMDLDTTAHTQASFDRYVYGSAEVIGEMCLAVFLNSYTGPRETPSEVREGARRLGAAYQKINFLRDLAMDDGELGRSYFPGVTVATLDDVTLATLVDDCRADIRAAEACLPALPRRARIGVTTTIDIYSRLLRRIERTPAQQLCTTRIRVANPVKAAYALRNACPWVSATRRVA